MFIHASLELPIPAATAAQRLYATLPRGLSELSDEAYAAGLQMQTRVGPLGDTPVLSKKVRLDLLEPIPVTDGLRVPLRWVATGVTGRLFPALDADLDITAIDEQRCVHTAVGRRRRPDRSFTAGPCRSGHDALAVTRHG